MKQILNPLDYLLELVGNVETFNKTFKKEIKHIKTKRFYVIGE